MAIAVDTSKNLGNTTASSLTVSYTNAGTILFVGAFTVTNLLTGVTFNGVSMTPIGSNIQVPTNTLFFNLFYLANPFIGTANIVINASSSAVMGGTAVSYTGANGTVDVSGSATATSATSISKSLTTTVVNDWTIAYCATDAGTVVAGSSTTLRQVGDSPNRAILDSNGALSIGSTSLNATFSTSDAAIIMAAFEPTSSAAGGALFFAQY